MQTNLFSKDLAFTSSAALRRCKRVRMPVGQQGDSCTCKLRQVAKAALMREQSEGCVKRKPIDDADDDDDEDEMEHQNGD